MPSPEAKPSPCGGPLSSVVCPTVKQSVKRRICRFASFALSVQVSLALAAAATPILHTDFENGPGGWIVMGESASLRAAHEEPDRREAKPSLAFDYEIGPKKFAAAILPVEPGALAGLDQIHFWVKTDIPTSLVVTLNEKGGGNYAAMAWSPGSVWQEVRLETRDFALGDKGNDPPDPDGKLDVDQVKAIAVADLAQIFGAAPRNPSMPIALADHAGKHTLLINGFEVLSGNSPRKDNLVIDQFDAPQLSWMSPGGAIFHLDNSRDHAPGPAMEVDYTRAPNALVLFARNLPPDIPANISTLR